MKQPRLTRRSGVMLLTMVMAIGLMIPGSIAAADESMTVVADGLHSPRGLAFGPGEILYASQAGDATAGGAIFQIRNAMSENPKMDTFVDGLASFGGPAADFIGVDGISVLGNGANFSLYGIMGVAPQMTGSDAFGQLFRVDRTGETENIVNVGEFDFEWGLDHPALWEEFATGDANPYDVLALPNHLYVVDAGTNTLNEVMDDGTIEILAFFPNEPIRDAVPTCVAQGPDGALYVGTLALEDSIVLGPMAKVYRVDPSQANLAEPWNSPMDVWA
ncbi:MAG TPA: ScyD/ScyE family protein, partial [Acidimicrobiia bacterium]|nr:ScyD/ScyE family protein [Acidimicrobiia bacterium]